MSRYKPTRQFAIEVTIRVVVGLLIVAAILLLVSGIAWGHPLGFTDPPSPNPGMTLLYVLGAGYLLAGVATGIWLITSLGKRGIQYSKLRRRR